MRVAVHGTSGSGKTTVARAISERTGAPFVELDALRHQPGWTVLPNDDFRAAVAGATSDDEWVVDGNYDMVRDLVDGQATHVVWLDLPRWLIMWQVIVRTVKRMALRRELWNGNRERFRAVVEPTHPIRWAWSTFHSRRSQYEHEMDARWIRLRSRREVRDWMAALPREPNKG